MNHLDQAPQSYHTKMANHWESRTTLIQLMRRHMTLQCVGHAKRFLTPTDVVDPRAVDAPLDGCDLDVMSETKHEGSCLCGGVRYEARGPLEAMARCHCTQCRKASGAEYATNASVASDALRFLQGEDQLREFESSPGQARVFCGNCGSPILKRVADKPEMVRLRLGCLDSELDQKPIVRVFLSEKLGFSEIPDDIPSFDTLPGAPNKV